jgi:hypothetical protein
MNLEEYLFQQWGAIEVWVPNKDWQPLQEESQQQDSDLLEDCEHPFWLMPMFKKKVNR